MEGQVETLHFLAHKKEDNNQSKINKQPEVPENQIAWNSNNHGIKETVKQNNQTGKAVDREKQRELADCEGRAGCNEGASCAGGADLRRN